MPARLEQTLDRVIAAMAAPVDVERERAKAQLRSQIDTVDAGAAWAAAREDIRTAALGLLDDWRELLARNVSTARASLARFLEGVGPKKAVASPMGMDRRWTREIPGRVKAA